MDRHIIGPVDGGGPMYLLGADGMGRDLFSRISGGTRISMSIGLLGVAISLVLGILLGGISGYYGGAIDNIIQRLIEFLRSLPTIPLWMGLAAAHAADVAAALRLLRHHDHPLASSAGHGLARVVRGRSWPLREEDFVLAARLDGARRHAIILRHMAPSFSSHIIASITLAIPAMILAETALSFLGLGCARRWSVGACCCRMRRMCTRCRYGALAAGAGLAVVIAVLSLNFLGDGLRDAADPYGMTRRLTKTKKHTHQPGSPRPSVHGHRSLKVRTWHQTAPCSK